MKVLFISQIVPYPAHGGVLQRGYNIIREISKYNEIHLLAFIHPDVLNSDEMIEVSRAELSKYCATIEYFTLWPKKSMLHKYIALVVGFISTIPFSCVAHKSKALHKRVSNIVESKGIEIIHYDTIALAQYREQVKHIPSVLTHHNIESELMNRRKEVEGNVLAKAYLKREVKKLKLYESTESPKFNVNITMSVVDASKLKKLAPGISTVVVANGVDLSYFKPIIGQETKSVIYTGGMNMYANMDAVLYFVKNIWPHIKQKIPEIKFYAIGQDPPEELKEIAAQDSGIQVLGYVDDVRPYVAKAGVYVVPLRVGGGTRLKVVDALAQGKAIVSTSLGCEGIDVISGKNIVIEDDPILFAERVVALLEDEDRRKAISTAARELAKSRYSWETMGKILNDTYVQVASESKRG